MIDEILWNRYASFRFLTSASTAQLVNLSSDIVGSECRRIFKGGHTATYHIDYPKKMYEYAPFFGYVRV